MKKLFSIILATLMIMSAVMFAIPASAGTAIAPNMDGWGPDDYVTVKQADPENVVKDGVIGEGEYERYYADLDVDNGTSPLFLVVFNMESYDRAEAMLATMEYYFSWDEVHGFNFAVRNKPEVIQQLLGLMDGEYPGDDFMRNLAYCVNFATDEEDTCLYYALGRRTDTLEYLEGYYITDWNEQRGVNADYDPTAEVDYIITYSDDGYAMIEWSIPLGVFSKSALGAGSVIQGSITATAGTAEVPFGPTDEEDSYGIGFGDYCYGMDQKLVRSGKADNVKYILSSDVIPAGNPFKYSVDEDTNEASITGYKGAGGEVEIPAEIDGHPVTDIVYRAFYNCTSLTAVTIPDSVKYVGPNAFSGCTALETVSVGSGVEEIGEWAFSGCSALTAIELPASVTTIGRNAFVACSSLVSANIPAGVDTIADRTFYNCTSLESIDIPDSVQKIGKSAFSHCESLESVAIPAGVTSIVYSAFKGCASLKEVSIPSSVTTVLDDAFSGCSSLEKVNYDGNADGWAAITIKKGNEPLQNAEIVYKHVHAFGKWVVTTPATCTAKGVETRTCACGETETRSIKALGHDFGKDGKAEKCARCGAKNPNAAKVEFTDVPADAYYAEPVSWAVTNNVTQGIGGGKFGPDNGCTRGQVVTFLWRAAGEPEPKSSSNPFSDVSAGDYFYKAVLWAVEQGVTAGTSPTTFSPNSTCTRGQIVTFLYRANGSPAPKSSSNPFTDVSSADYFYSAILWAVENKITSGTSATTFSPSATCTRAQVVTFLYRAMA